MEGENRKKPNNKRKKKENQFDFNHLSPLTDIGAKILFRDLRNLNILKSFINAVLERLDEKVESIVLSESELLGNLKKGIKSKSVIFDVNCINHKGELINIEFQKKEQVDFFNRLDFYASRLYSSQLNAGEDYSKLKKVYQICVMDFIPHEFELPEGKYISYLKTMDIEEKNVVLNNLTRAFIFLPNFTKKVDELVTQLDKFLYLIKHLQDMETLPETFNDPIFHKISKLMSYPNFNTNDKELRQIMDEWAIQNQKKAELKNKKELERLNKLADKYKQKGLEEGREEGREEGKAKGMEEGKREGLEQGLAQGLEQGKNQMYMAIKLLLSNTPIDEIIEKTQLTSEEIKELQNTLNL